MDKEDSLEEAALSRGYNDRVAGEGTEEKSLPGQGNSKHRELGTKKKKSVPSLSLPGHSSLRAGILAVSFTAVSIMPRTSWDTHMFMRNGRMNEWPSSKQDSLTTSLAGLPCVPPVRGG